MSGVGGGEKLGLIGMFASMAANSAANQAQAQADIREWEQLPSNVWLATLDRKMAAPNVDVRLEVAGSPVNNQAKRVADAPSCQLYWGRAIDLNATSSEMGPVEPGRHDRDSVFRREVAGMFGT